MQLDSTESTNDRARELALAGAPHGTVVIAEEQTAGRGRQGRSWLARRGEALTMSIVLRVEIDQLRQLPLAAPLAVCDAVTELVGSDCKIKWPNDVWLDGLKLAGILIEARPQEGWAILGIGLNTRTERFSDEIASIATSLRLATGKTVDNGKALRALLDCLAERLAAEPERLLDDYREHDALHGKQISWSGGSGTAQGIDDQGNLVVFTAEDERGTLDAGEVHLEKIED